MEGEFLERMSLVFEQAQARNPLRICRYMISFYAQIGH
jgi:hypothetical protein